jgi:hypothetical protein
MKGCVSAGGVAAKAAGLRFLPGTNMKGAFSATSAQYWGWVDVVRHGKVLFVKREERLVLGGSKPNSSSIYMARTQNSHAQDSPSDRPKTVRLVGKQSIPIGNAQTRQKSRKVRKGLRLRHGTTLGASIKRRWNRLSCPCLTCAPLNLKGGSISSYIAFALRLAPSSSITTTGRISSLGSGE